MDRCETADVHALLQGVIECSLAYCGYYKSPQRLHDLASTLAGLAGVERERAEAIGRACSLCDLGMVGMPHELLSRDGPLSPTERQVLQEHAVIGRDLLATVHHPDFALAASVAAHHHERLDGGGYPAGLSGDDIPFEARVAAVVSIYVALTQPRPFRRVRTHAEALELLRNLSGNHLDPQLVALVIAHEQRFEACGLPSGSDAD